MQRKIFIDILVHIVPSAFLFLCQGPIKYIFRFHFNNSYFSSHTIVYHRTVNFHFSSSFSNVQGMPCAPLVFSDSFPPLYQKLLPIEVLCKKTDPHHILSTRKQGKWKLLVISQKQGCTRKGTSSRIHSDTVLYCICQIQPNSKYWDGNAI